MIAKKLKSGPKLSVALGSLLAASLASSLVAGPAQAQSTVTFGGSGSTSNGVQGNAAASSAAAPVAGPAPDALEAEWLERDLRLGETSNLTGGVGLLHMHHAAGSAPGQFRLGFTTEYFSAGFLCTPENPCANPRGGAKVTSDTLDHIGGTLTLGVTITKWLDAYAGTGAYANSDDQNRPSLLQVLGDTDFGLKAYFPLSKVFAVGGFTELWLINGTGSVGLDGGGTGFKLGPVVTMDMRGMESKTPLRFSFQADYMFDNSGDVLASTEAPNARNQPVTRIERFGLNVNRVDHLDLALGGEAFLLENRIRPFVEYNMLIPNNRQNYLCKPNNISGDKCLANDAVVPSKLTIGSRFLPWKKGFSLTAALDIGISGVSNFVEELAPTAPWTLFLGAGWSIDTWDRPPVEKIKVVEKTIEGKPPVRGHVKGFVHEKEKSEGVANAIVAWENHPELTALATGVDGRFTTQELIEGTYNFAIKADGFKDGTCAGSLKGGQDVQIDCPLEALPRVGNIVGHVKDAETQTGVPGATIKLTDSAKRETNLTADGSGNFRATDVAPGTASLAVDAEGYLELVQPQDIKIRQDNEIDLLVRKRPKVGLVNVGKTEITMKQQIQFATDSAVILPESLQLMTEIADAMIRTPRIKRVEIQGHTDNTGTADHNKILSEQRAEAVRTWLTQHGVDPGRLVARGFGQEKPLVPNVTTANKARNRRVQFIILEQDPAAPEAPKGAPKAAPKKDPVFPTP